MAGRFKKYVEKLRHWPSPVRIIIGILLVIFGLLGFLPVVGYWMIPLGLLVLSLDFPWARRAYLNLIVLWRRLREKFRRNSS